ncbi:MAG: translation initiation factor IF-2, partial [Bacteroidia bacterium]
LLKEYSTDINAKKESEKLILKELERKQEAIALEKEQQEEEEEEAANITRALTVVTEEPVSKPVSKPEVSVPDKREKAENIVSETASPEKPAIKKAPEPSKTDVKINIVGKIDLETLKPPKKSVKEVEKKAKPTPEEKPEIKEEKALNEEPKVETELPLTAEKPEEKIETAEDSGIEVAEPKAEPEKPEKGEISTFIKTEVRKLSGPTVVGRIDLPKIEDKKKAQPERRGKEIKKPGEATTVNKGPREKRIRIKKDKEKVALKPATGDKQDDHKKKKGVIRHEISTEDVQKQIKETLARLTTKGKSKGSKYRREKRDAVSQRHKEEIEKQELEKNILKVTEFVSVNELATMMNIPVTDIISTCMNLGLFVSINQRLDAETMSLVAEEFNYEIEFVSAEVLEAVREEEDEPEELIFRPPIVTVMGHVDHGKTKLLDQIRDANVIAGEAGGITQHIGAYNVTLADGRQITFLDTPGHEAFTAMRARGAQITDIAIIVVAADDGVMPQTVEAINHASAAGVPIVFAINKVDKQSANPEKIKEELANMNYLVEDWGGKYQSQEISAKAGLNIDLLLEKVLLEAELLDLKANPAKRASGTVIESSLDKGRGFVATILVKSGTLRIGDVVLAGTHYGHIKAMYNERGIRILEAGPSTPVLILGLNGAPQAGDKFNVMETEKEAKEITNKRTQLQREQGLRTQKHITLDEIGRRIAIGNFQELNIIVKGDVDGSVEALSDSLIKLSTEEIQVSIRHKAVGQISESDVLLAAASNAIIVGFQVRPSLSARKLAEKEEIDVRLYSIIYDAINEIRSAMEGMLSPEVKEEITGIIEIREVFNITRVGTVAGCYVREGKVTRNSKIRVIRDGIVKFTGELGSLKRFKDDAREVASGYECGLNVNHFNDIQVGDFIECYTQVEVKKTL